MQQIFLSLFVWFFILIPKQAFAIRMGTCKAGKCVTIYDPTTDKWTVGARVPTSADPYYYAAVLPNGEILFLDRGVTAIYSPLIDSWRRVRSPLAPAYQASALTLNSGKVLVLGEVPGDNAVTHVQIYDYKSDQWKELAPLNIPTGLAGPMPGRLVKLTDGRAIYFSGGGSGEIHLFDEHTETWESYPAPFGVRNWASVIVLQNGSVLVLGGTDPSLGQKSSRVGAIFSPITQQWNPIADMPIGRTMFATYLLLNGRVLVAAGLTDQSGPFGGYYSTKKVHIFDPIANTWTEGGDLSYAQTVNTDNPGPTISPIILGDGCDQEKRAQIYDQVKKSWRLTSKGPPNVSTYFKLLPDGRFFTISGGKCD